MNRTLSISAIVVACGVLVSAYLVSSHTINKPLSISSDSEISESLSNFQPSFQSNPQPNSNNSNYSEKSDEITTIKQQLSMATHAINTLSAQIKSLESSSHRNDSISSIDNQETSEISSEEYSAALIGKLDEIVYDEIQTSGVNSHLENAAYDALSFIPDNSSFGQLECGETFCKVDIHHSDSGNHKKIYDEMIDGKLKWEGPFVLHHTEDGGADLSLLYLGKPGSELPVIPTSKSTMIN